MLTKKMWIEKCVCALSFKMIEQIKKLDFLYCFFFIHVLKKEKRKNQNNVLTLRTNTEKMMMLVFIWFVLGARWLVKRGRMWVYEYVYVCICRYVTDNNRV